MADEMMCEIFTLKPLKTYLHYHNAYGTQTSQADDFTWGTPTQKVTWPFDHVVA